MNKMSWTLLIWIVALCGMVSASGTMLGGSEHQPPIITEAIPVKTPEQKIPLIVHRMPSTPASIASRNQRFLFADETLLAPDSSVEKEFEWCRNAGAVAVVQDDMTESSVEAARKAGLKLILLPNMTPLRMIWYGATMEDPESVARYWVKMIQETEQYSDVLYHQDGRLVMWLFDATSAPPEYYKTVRQKVREMGYDPIILYHAQLRSVHNTPAVVEAYLKMFDGAFVWGDGYETIQKMLEMIVFARDKIEKETGIRKQVILSSKPGHWRPEKGIFIDPHGTREFRQTIDLAYRYKLDGLNVESWNDFGEMHHVQPSVLKSTVLSDLCTYYGNLGVGHPEPVEYPGLYVSHRRDVMAGEYLECEILYLPVAEVGTRTVRLILQTSEGREIFASDPWNITSAEAGAKTFNIPTSVLGVPETVFPVLEINGKKQPTGTFCDINASRMPYPFTMNMSMAKSLHPEAVQFRMDGHDAGSSYVSTNVLRAEISVQSSKKISRIEIIKNNTPVYCAAFDQFMRTKSPSNSYQIAGFYWDIPGPVAALKNASLNGMDFGGSITLHGGEAIHAIHVKNATPVLSSSSFIEWGGLDGSRRRPNDGVEIAFEGDEDTVFDVNMPNQAPSFKIKWGDILREGWKEYPLLSHSRLVVRPMFGLMGHPVGLGITNYSGTVDIPQDEELPNRILNDRNRSSYFLRVIAEDNSIYRSAPIHVTSAASTNMIRTYTWDMEKEKRYEILVPEIALKEISWKFTGSSTRLIPDCNRTGYALELGGLYERDGRFDPDQIPDVVRDGDSFALNFDGNDLVMTRPQLVPIGSWMLDMWIKPTHVGSNQEQFIFDVPEVVSIVLQTNGIFRVWYGDSQFANVRLTGKTVLENGRWYRLSFIYDLNQARLILDGNLEASAPVEGFRYRITQRANIGATLPYGKHMSLADRGFHGLVKDITITADADKMDAVSFKKREKTPASVIYYDDFNGEGTVPLNGTAPDSAPANEVWQGSVAGSRWMADGTITNAAWERRNMFLPFTPEAGKIYTLKMDVVRIGRLNTFYFGFTRNASFAGGGFRWRQITLELPRTWFQLQSTEMYRRLSARMPRGRGLSLRFRMRTE